MRNLSQDESSVLCCVCFYCEQFAALLVAPIRQDAAAEFCHYLAACMCVLFVRVHHDVTVV